MASIHLKFALLVFVWSSLCSAWRVPAFRTLRRLPKLAGHQLNDQSDLVGITVTTRNIRADSIGRSKLDSYDAVYKDAGSEKVGLTLDSPGTKILEIIFNPIALVFALYFVLVGYTQVGAMINSVLATLRLRKRDNVAATAVDEPFQVYECDNCGMQMRPAKGRVHKILNKERFRCARCGARASAYFNIDDMSDPRAVARKKRLEEAELMEGDDRDDLEGEDLH